MVSGGNPNHGPLVVTQATDINTDPSYSRASDPDMALSGSSGQNIAVASGGNTGYLDQFGPWQQHKLWTSEWLLVAT